MAVMTGDHGAGAFRSMPPARLEPENHDLVMLHTTGHTIGGNSLTGARNYFGPPPPPNVGPGQPNRLSPDSADTDRGF